VIRLPWWVAERIWKLFHRDAATVGVSLAGYHDSLGGVGNYAMSFLLAWPHRFPASPVRLFCGKQTFQAGRRLPFRSRVGQRYLANPSELADASSDCDVIFFPCGHIEPSPPPPGLVFHLADTQEWFFPENFSPEEHGRRRNLYRTLLAYAEALFVPSEFTRRCVIELLGFEPARVFVVPVVSADLPQEGHRPKEAPDGDFLYFPADDYPHKNHSRLIQALAKLNDEGVEIPLVCTGSRVSDGEWLDLAGEKRLRVAHLGRVTRAEVRWLYDHARSVVMPSCFEGFGIPLLESFTCRVPVAAANFSSLSEIGGDAVRLFDPFSISEIASGILQVWTDEELRQSLVKNGLRRLEEFSVPKIIRTHAECFNEIKASGRRTPHRSVRLPRLDPDRAWLMAGRDRPNRKITSPPKCSTAKARCPEIHFFTLVLNGMPFLEEQWKVLQSLDIPFRWHLIEGIAELKADTGWSVVRGGRCPDEFHRDFLSIDGTSDFIDSLASEYPDVVSCHRTDGPWPGKRAMCQAAVEEIDHEVLLWQLDADEIWGGETIRAVGEEFASSDKWQAAQFRCRFYVSPNHVLDNIGSYGNDPRVEWRRVWRFRPGDEWTSHEPPVLSRRGRDLFEHPHLSAETTSQHGWKFDHFAYVREEQVRFKEAYYGYPGAVEGWNRLRGSEGEAVMASEYLSWIPSGLWAVRNETAQLLS